MKILGAEIAAIVVGIAVIGYFIYKGFNSTANPLTNGGNGGGNGTGGILGGGYSADPNDGSSNGVVNNIDSLIFGSGSGDTNTGETAGTSETYTGAATEILNSPWQVVKSIF